MNIIVRGRCKVNGTYKPIEYMCDENDVQLEVYDEEFYNAYIRLFNGEYMLVKVKESEYDRLGDIKMRKGIDRLLRDYAEVGEEV